MTWVLSTKPKKKINLNELATHVAIRERGKQQLSIAQVKEVMRHTLNRLGQLYLQNPRGVTALLEKRGPLPDPR